MKFRVVRQSSDCGVASERTVITRNGDDWRNTSSELGVSNYIKPNDLPANHVNATIFGGAQAYAGISVEINDVISNESEVKVYYTLATNNPLSARSSARRRRA